MVKSLNAWSVVSYCIILLIVFESPRALRLLICVLKMNEGLTGLEQHESE